MQPNSNPLQKATHDVYHAPETAPIHEATHEFVRSPGDDTGLRFLFRDAQPGTAAFARAHLVGSSAPEPVIERYDGVGVEGFGAVELIDGNTGQSITKVNRHLRRRIEARDS